MRLVLATRPVPKARPRHDSRSGLMYTPRRTKAFADLVRRTGQIAMCGHGPFPGPVRATIRIYFPVPKGWPPARRAAALRGEILPTMRPDLDNTLKNALDALNAVVYFDDAQICVEHTEKHFAAEARIELVFEAIAAAGSTQRGDRPPASADDARPAVSAVPPRRAA